VVLWRLQERLLSGYRRESLDLVNVCFIAIVSSTWNIKVICICQLLLILTPCRDLPLRYLLFIPQIYIFAEKQTFRFGELSKLLFVNFDHSSSVAGLGWGVMACIIHFRRYIVIGCSTRVILVHQIEIASLALQHWLIFDCPLRRYLRQLCGSSLLLSVKKLIILGGLVIMFQLHLTPLLRSFRSQFQFRIHSWLRFKVVDDDIWIVSWRMGFLLPLPQQASQVRWVLLVVSVVSCIQEVLVWAGRPILFGIL
jgi:hypothetical protein